MSNSRLEKAPAASNAGNAPNPKHPNCFGNVSNYRWADAFYHKDVNAFLSIFHPNVTQSASTSPFITFGSKEVAETFGWASEFYQRCDFTHQASTESHDFMEFDLTTANNMLMTGMTVLTKDLNGKVIKVFNGHRNLTETLLFPEHFVKGPKNKGIVSLFHKKALKKYGIDLKYARNTTGFLQAKEVVEQAYTHAFKQANRESFSEILDDGVKLSASYVARTVIGNQAVSQCLASLSGFYEHCIFTTQAQVENRTYLLYRGMLRNGLMVSDGFLILVKNGEGKIIEVLDNPIPMHAGTLISAYLSDCSEDKAFADKYFYSDNLFRRAVKEYGLNDVYGDNTRDLSSFKGVIAQFFLKV